MRTKYRVLFLIALVLSGLVLVGAFYYTRVGTPLKSSLAPVFQVLGHATQALDSLIARVVPVDSLDERELGQVIAVRYNREANKADLDFIYLNELVKNFARALKKPFEYKVYVLDQQEPNALALPGGVVLVTRGLLNVMNSEAELVAVLAHELGHIERDHCFEAAKFQLLAQRVGLQTYGQIADLVVKLLIGHTFSKTQEDQADEYAYEFLIHSSYDPRGVGESFAQMLTYGQGKKGLTAKESRANVLRDYFMSHPPLAIRKEKFMERANAWWRAHPTERRYVGKWNLERRKSFYDFSNIETEWVTGSIL